MIHDRDIFRSAQVLVKRHGEDAPVHAAMRADAMLEKGDLNGYAVWKRVLRAAGELQRTKPGPGGVHCNKEGVFVTLRRVHFDMPSEDQNL